jgi:hypothetical protein
MFPDGCWYSRQGHNASVFHVGVKKLHRLSGSRGAFLFRMNVVAASFDINANQEI